MSMPQGHEQERLEIIAACEIALLALIQAIVKAKRLPHDTTQLRHELFLAGLRLANDIQALLRTDMVERYFAMLREHDLDGDQPA
jgi:hypothetical protein